MRMWNVPTELMCRKHLMGEHVETHMMLGTLKRGISMQGYISRGLFDIRILQARHDELATEALYRGYRHESPLDVSAVPIIDIERYYGHVDTDANLIELAKRCHDCAERQIAVDNF